MSKVCFAAIGTGAFSGAFSIVVECTFLFYQIWGGLKNGIMFEHQGKNIIRVYLYSLQEHIRGEIQNPDEWLQSDRSHRFWWALQVVNGFGYTELCFF